MYSDCNCTSWFWETGIDLVVTCSDDLFRQRLRGYIGYLALEYRYYDLLKSHMLTAKASAFRRENIVISSPSSQTRLPKRRCARTADFYMSRLSERD